MQTRPWYGIWSDPDGSGARRIREVVAGGPAEGSGLEPGDVLEKVDGIDQVQQRAGRAGWKTLPPTQFHVKREGREMTFQVTPCRVPEDVLARMIGKHMIEAHIAYETGTESGTKR